MLKIGDKVVFKDNADNRAFLKRKLPNLKADAVFTIRDHRGTLCFLEIPESYDRITSFEKRIELYKPEEKTMKRYIIMHKYIKTFSLEEAKNEFTRTGGASQLTDLVIVEVGEVFKVEKQITLTTTTLPTN